MILKEFGKFLGDTVLMTFEELYKSFKTDKELKQAFESLNRYINKKAKEERNQG